MEKIFIDCTPTWSAVAVACISILRNPKADHDDIVYARREIQRMGRIVDHYVELEKKKREVK